jgi:threonine/homoserine/homoserine lactone efflux protein
MSSLLNMWALGGAALVWLGFAVWTIRWLSNRARERPSKMVFGRGVKFFGI